MAIGIRISEFDTWQPGYATAVVTVYKAGTTTLASLYSQPGLTGALANPQTLSSRTDGAGLTYGKWAQPVYVGEAYELAISTGERTGIERVPLFTLDGADASEALVTPTGGTAARELQAIAADVVRLASFGAVTGSPGGNATLLAAAIAYAASLGGGDVLLPTGTIEITVAEIPQGVVVRGAGRGVTTLRSTQAQRVITVAGDRAGLADLTLDGLNLTASSVGVYAVGRVEPTLERVEIKRFATGLQMKGATRPRFRDLDIANCVTGADLRGDMDAGASGIGSALRTLLWDGGKVSLCSTAGVILSFEDAMCEGIVLRQVDFDTNSGTALRLNGARFTQLDGGRFSGNTVNLSIADDSDLSQSANNTVRAFLAREVRFSGGQVQLDGTCDNVVFDLSDFADVDFVLSIPTSPILLLDCQEDAATTATGATEKLQRASRLERGTFSGITTDGNYITAWSIVPDPGEVMQITARVLGRQRNGTNYLSHEIKGSVVRAAATLGFDLASGTLTVGSIVTGATSAASARIVANSQTGNAGTLSVRDIKGVFEVGESLATSAGETAKCVAPLNSPTTTVDAAWVGDLAPNVQTDADWDVTIDASSPQARLRVRGDTGHTVEWVCQVDVLRP